MGKDELENKSNSDNALLCVVLINAQVHGIGKDELYCNWYKCPKCNNRNIQFEDNYCSNCGCKFEWTGHYE